ncbi:hypothetical protein [Algoriphagus sp. AK58]|uniref:hypothetical protein n=1 Tax=Algoriphagus sp. AK58 TaxID=1406877 RepID=UPI00164FCE81|nr:hypothetical protein [Algoriphagus sp. AK58]MBC6365285.1 hypothetical protein [Algoriphagus sp. AK58]
MEQKELNRRMPYNSWSFVIVLTIALGLAPILGEPHIWGKIRWIAGGAVGMKLIDWGDFFMHGAPWVLLIRLGIIELKSRMKSAKA